MAERYQDRPFPSDDYGRGGDQHGKADSDPLAELARLIGQTDPFAAQSQPGARSPVAPAPAPSYQDDDYRQDDYQQDYVELAAPTPPGPPSWMWCAFLQPAPAAAPESAYPVTVSPVHPLHRYSAQPAAPEPVLRQPHAYQDHAYPEQAYLLQDQAYQQQAYQPDA